MCARLISTAVVVVVLAVFVGLTSPAGCAPATGPPHRVPFSSNKGLLISEAPVRGTVTTAGRDRYRFITVTDEQVTLAITSPKVSLPGNSLQMLLYDASGSNDASGTYILPRQRRSISPPTSAQAGLTTVVISAYSAGTSGRFLLTYES